MKQVDQDRPRIGVLTFHYGYNEGTLLQAYATQLLMLEHAHASLCEVVDHRYSVKEKVNFRAPENGREQCLLDFQQNTLRASAYKGYDNDLESTWRHINRSYDLVLLGSDEVWRLDYTTTRRFGLPVRRQVNPWAPAFPNLYWPRPGSIRVPCIAMAASLSEKDRVSGIPLWDRIRIRRALRSLACITVRDTRTSRFVQAITGLPDTQVKFLPDPTFYLPPAPNTLLAKLDAMLSAVGVPPEQRDVLIVSPSESRTLQEAIALFGNRGRKLACLNRMHQGCHFDLSRLAIGPVEWSAIPHLFNLVVTDRFHAAVFAIKAGTRVLAIDARLQESGSPSKLLDLFERFDIANHWISACNGNGRSAGDGLAKILDSAWPQDAIKVRISEFHSALQRFASAIPNRIGN